VKFIKAQRIRWLGRAVSFFYIHCVRKVAVHLQKVLKVMFTSVYSGLNLFNVIRKHFLHICIRKVVVHLQKMFEVMSKSVYTGQQCLRTVASVHSDFPNTLYYAEY
jgi:hypothetical protein